MQEQQYESFASEPERSFIRQGVRDRWSEGEKLQIEPKQRGGFSPYTTLFLAIVIVVVLLIVFFLFAAIAIHIHAVPGGGIHAAPGGGPGPDRLFP